MKESQIESPHTPLVRLRPTDLSISGRIGPSHIVQCDSHLRESRSIEPASPILFSTDWHCLSVWGRLSYPDETQRCEKEYGNYLANLCECCGSENGSNEMTPDGLIKALKRR